MKKRKSKKAKCHKVIPKIRYKNFSDLCKVIVNSKHCWKNSKLSNDKLTICDLCEIDREKFHEDDMKKVKGKKFCSDVFAGFGASNKNGKFQELEYFNDKNVDVFVMLLANGGERTKNWPRFWKYKIRKPNTCAKYLYKYYLREKKVRYHQEFMRYLLEGISGKSYFVSDLIKCFVRLHKTRETKETKFGENEKAAIRYCGEYLEKQIDCLKPRIIICLGDINFNFLKKKRILLKDEKYEKYVKNKKKIHPISKVWGLSGKIKEKKIKIIYAPFPSQTTADKWVKIGGFKKILELID